MGNEHTNKMTQNTKSIGRPADGKDGHRSSVAEIVDEDDDNVNVNDASHAAQLS